MVERAPLRPVPRRPSGPVDPDVAARHVAAQLPELDPFPRAALALVTLAGRSRAEAAARTGLSAHDFATALHRGRKELRRSVEPLAGSGWCERAERLISDRLDGELDHLGAARLDVHLRNCPRCVEHERRLVQAIDGLVAGLVGEPEQAPVPGPPAPLRLAAPSTPPERAPSLGRPAIAARGLAAPSGRRSDWARAGRRRRPASLPAPSGPSRLPLPGSRGRSSPGRRRRRPLRPLRTRRLSRSRSSPAPKSHDRTIPQTGRWGRRTIRGMRSNCRGRWRAC